MLLLRPPLLSALLLFLLLLLVLLAAERCAAAPRHRGSSARLRGSGARAERSGTARDVMEQAGRKQRHPVRLTGRGFRGQERRNRQRHGTESHSRDLQQKEKFIIHLTGPLYFDPKCRKQFYRLYNNTRECTIPALNPIPSNLRSEAKKAAKILREFTEISNRNGPDKLIPAHVIAKAEGLAIISVIKAGFMITARGGSGIVIARLADRSWSAPSAIGIAGLGGGFEIGVEVSDLVIILNQRRAIEAFTKGGNLTLGGNCTVAVGPVGRNVEADVALRSTAAVFTYCRSRGLFAGISLEGSYLIERKDANRKFYRRDIRASAVLNGDVDPPSECADLYHILDVYTEAYCTDSANKNKPSSVHTSRSAAAPKQFSSQRPTASSAEKNTLYPNLSASNSETSKSWFASGGASGPLVVTAIHPFTAVHPGDLTFAPGAKITVITRTESQYDWWEGKLDNGQVGIFPANFVTF